MQNGFSHICKTRGLGSTIARAWVWNDHLLAFELGQQQFWLAWLGELFLGIVSTYRGIIDGQIETQVESDRLWKEYPHECVCRICAREEARDMLCVAYIDCVPSSVSSRDLHITTETECVNIDLPSRRLRSHKAIHASWLILSGHGTVEVDAAPTLSTYKRRDSIVQVV